MLLHFPCGRHRNLRHPNCFSKRMLRRVLNSRISTSCLAPLAISLRYLHICLLTPAYLHELSRVSYTGVRLHRRSFYKDFLSVRHGFIARDDTFACRQSVQQRTAADSSVQQRTAAASAPHFALDFAGPSRIPQGAILSHVGSPRCFSSFFKMLKKKMKTASRLWNLILEPPRLPWGIPRLPQGGERLILCRKYVDFTMSPESSLGSSWAPE